MSRSCFIKRMTLIYGKKEHGSEIIADLIAKRDARVKRNTTIQTAYLLTLEKDRNIKVGLTALEDGTTKNRYELRAMVKAGTHESCKQRKIRLNKERRAKLKTSN